MVWFFGAVGGVDIFSFLERRLEFVVYGVCYFLFSVGYFKVVFVKVIFFRGVGDSIEKLKVSYK